MDLHIESGYLYFTDNGSSTYSKGIFRGKSDGGYFNSVVSSGVGIRGIPGIAVDWIAGMKKPTYSPFLFITFTTRLMRKNMLLSSHYSFITMSVKAEPRASVHQNISSKQEVFCNYPKNTKK